MAILRSVHAMHKDKQTLWAGNVSNTQAHVVCIMCILLKVHTNQKSHGHQYVYLSPLIEKSSLHFTNSWSFTGKFHHIYPAGGAHVATIRRRKKMK